VKAAVQQAGASARHSSHIDTNLLAASGW